MERCVRWYLPEGDLQVIDLGAADVNGSYRALFPARAHFRGFDLAEGPGVDVVLEDPYHLPIESSSVDVILSGQMMEHCPFFWKVFEEIARVLEEGGLAFVIVPSGGPIHRYPVDCYRFYPDSFVAMAEWAGLRLVDSWMDDRGPWSDLVGVFQKGGKLTRRTAPPPPAPGKFRNEPNPDPAVEVISGQRPYLEVLDLLHRTLAPELYVEIGVRHGRSLALARGRAVAIDPCPEVDQLPAGASLHVSTSDDFFFFKARELLDRPVDLAFIDDMHLAEFVYRDFMNLERYMSRGGVIAIDDVFPNHPIQAARDRSSRVWTGDVWRFVQLLSELRPDLGLTFLDTSPTGLLLVHRLDPSNRVLSDRYNPVVRQLLAQSADVAPASVLTRQKALPPTDGAVLAALGRNLAA
jgi:SAM-dependent methyltransferase